MPYIKNKDRVNPNRIVQLMKDTGVTANGDLKYILKSFGKKSVVLSYNKFKNYLGELNECSAEVKRRLLSGLPETERHVYPHVPRKKLDLVVQLMIDLGIKVNGDLNYILYKFCKETIKTYEGILFFNIDLGHTVVELREEVLAPYENLKCIENGDV